MVRGARIAGDAARIIRHSYENVLTCLSHLYLFAYSKNPPSSSSIFEHSAELCRQELLLFAIHFRRICERTISLAEVSSETVMVLKDQDWNPLAVTRIINFIIHHKEINIIRTKEHLRFLAEFDPGKDLDSQAHLVMFGRGTQIDATCSVINEKNDMIIFMLKDLVGIIVDKILPNIEDFCSDGGLFLDIDL